MSKHLTKEQIREFREAFDVFDKDGDGSLTVVEIGEVMSKLGQRSSESEIQKMVEEVDSKGAGEIDFEDFCKMMQRMMIGDEEEYNEVKETFDCFDRRGTGEISVSDLKQVLNNLDTAGARLSSRQIDNIIEELDPKDTGKACYADFCAVFKFE